MLDDDKMSPEQYEQFLSEGGSIETNPNPEGYAALLNPAPTQGPHARSRYIGQTALLRGTPNDLETQVELANSPNARGEYKVASDEHYNTRLSEVAQRLNLALGSAPTTMEEVVNAEQQEVLAIQEKKNSPLAQEEAYATNAALYGSATVAEQKAHQVALANELVEMTEGRGWVDDLGDILGYFVPFGEAKDISDIPDAVGNRPELAEIAGEDIEAIVGAWKGLPPDRQMALLPDLQAAIMEATETLGITDGNMLKTVSILQNFFSLEGAEGIRKDQILDVAFGVADVVPVAAIRKLKPLEKLAAASVLKEATQKTIGESSAIKVAADAGDAGSAANHTVGAMLSETDAVATGTTKTGAAQSAMPLHTEEWFRDVVNDDALPSAVADKLNEAAYKAEGFSRKLTDESDLMQIGLLNQSERNQVVEGFFEHMERKGEDYLTENLEMGNLRIVKENERGFTYAFTLKDKARPTTADGKEKLILRQGEVEFRINDVTGDYIATTNDTAAQSASKLLSPTAWSVRTDAGDFNLEIKRALQGDDLSKAYVKSTTDMLDWAIEPVRGITQGKARERLDLVLEAGDEYINAQTQVQGRVFTPTELAAGIKTKKDIVYLTDPKEVEAYYRWRMYSDATADAENQVLRRELEVAGFKDVKLFSVATPDGEMGAVRNVRNANRAVGKPFDNVGAALASTRGRNGQGIWDDRLGKTVDITEDYIRKAYDEGDVIVRFKKDWNTKGTGDLDGSGEMVQYARVSKERVSELPEQVLNYKAGYVPKINEARYVVSQMMPMIARNRPNLMRSQAMRAFDSLDDARAFREELIVKYAAKNDLDLTNPTVRSNLEKVFPEVGNVEDLPLSTRLEEAVGSHAGLYHATRSKDELLFGLSGQKMSRVSPLEAFQRHANHIGSFVSQNEMRIAREKRWLNTVRRVFPEAQVKGFGDTQLPTGTGQARALEAIRKQISEWNGIPTREEQLFESMLQRLHDWALNAGRQRGFGYADKESIKSIQWLMHANPASAIKSAVMHNLLGMFNPAQLITQASAGLVAMSRHPQGAFYGAKSMATFGILDNIRNPKALEGAIAKMRQTGEMGKAEVDAYRAWSKTGLREAVYNNSDLAQLTSTGRGMTGKLWNNFDFMSLYFYRAGELAARRATFRIEFGEWAKRTGKSTPNDRELSEILEEVNKNMLELGPANKAFWQGGAGTGTFRQILGVATQFMQVGTKTLELIFKGQGRGGFSGAERRRMLLVNMALFGLRGAPLGGLIAGGILNYSGNSPTERGPVFDTVENGVVSTMANMLLGSDIDFAERVSIGAQTTEMVKDLVESEDPIWIKAFGPAAGGVFGRVGDAFAELSLFAQVDWSSHQELDPNAMKLGWSVLGEIPSTGRNWMKYQQMKNLNQILDRRKRVLVQDDFDPITEAAVLLGFKPLREQRTRQLQMDSLDIKEQIQEYADVRTRIYHRAIFEMKLDKEANLAIQAALQLHDEATPAWVRMKGQEMWLDRIYGKANKSMEERQIIEFLNRTAVEKLGEDFRAQATGEQGQYVPFKQLLDGPQE